MSEFATAFSARLRIRYSLRSKSSRSGRSRPGADEDLAEDRFDRFRAVSDRRVVGGNIAPAQHAFVRCARLPLQKVPRSVVRESASRGRQTIPTPYSPGSGRFDSQLLHSLFRNSCGICIRIPAPSPVFDFAAFGAAMQQVHENLKRFPNNGVRFASVDVDDKADAATVVLKLWIVQALFLGHTRIHVSASLETFRRTCLSDPLSRQGCSEHTLSVSLNKSAGKMKVLYIRKTNAYSFRFGRLLIMNLETLIASTATSFARAVFRWALPRTGSRSPRPVRQSGNWKKNWVRS